MQVNDINEILDAKLLEQRRSQEKRDYLGASALGEECGRKIQLQYLGNDIEITAQNIRTFAIGTHLESLIAEWMILAGFALRTRDENGEPFGFSVADGKLQGHVDGMICSFPSELQQREPNIIGSRDHPWLWECKTMNNKTRTFLI